MKKYYSTTEASKLLKISRQAVVKAIKKKQLKAKRKGRLWKIESEALDCFVESRNREIPFPKAAFEKILEMVDDMNPEQKRKLDISLDNLIEVLKKHGFTE